MRHAAPVTLTIASVLLATSACKSVECEDRRDCPAAFDCIDNKCVERDTIIPPPPPPILDTGVLPDTGADGGVPDTGDAGPVDTGDAGPLPDTGPVDMGPRPDGGPGVLPNEGIIEVGEFDRTAGTELDARGFFRDNSGVTYLISTQTFPSGCVLRSEKYQSGIFAGIENLTISIVPGQNPVLNPIVLTHTIFGEYTPTPPLQTGHFTNDPANIDIQSPGASGDLTPTMITMQTPSEPSFSSPPLNPTLNLGQPVLFTYANPVRGDVIIELIDTSKEVWLTCRPNPVGGSFTLGSKEIAAFYAENPVGEVTIEARIETETMQNVAVVGSAMTLPVKVLMQQGQRWTAQ